MYVGHNLIKYWRSRKLGLAGKNVRDSVNTFSFILIRL